MKKVLIILAVCCFCTSTLCTCDNSVRRSREEKEKNYGNANKEIQQCLDDLDFEGAHAIFNRIPSDESVMSKFDQEELQEKIYRAEITFLVDQSTDEAWQKAFILVQGYKSKLSDPYSYDAKLELGSLLADFAVSFENHETAIRIGQLLDGIIDYLENGKENAVFEKDWQERIDKARSIYKKCSRVYTADDLLQKKVVFDIENENMIEKLASLNKKDASDMILFALAEKGKNLPSRPSINGYVKSDSYGKLDRTEHGMYNKKIKEYNAQCKSVMNIAIASKNLYLAKSVIPKMKQVFVYTDLGDWVKVVEKRNDHSSLYEAFKLSLSNEDIDDAKQTLNNAIKNGLFK